MTETVDRLKTLRGNTAYPRGGICKICGFGGSDVSFRFSDVCGLHECRVKAGVCDCIACQKKKKADIKREKQTILTDLVAIKNLDASSSDLVSHFVNYKRIAERAEKLLGVSSD